MQPGNCFVIFMWEQLLCARPGGLSSGNKLAVARLGNAQGVYCPLLEHSAYCLVFLKTKWLRIDCSNLFIQRWDGSVSHPKITLKSDYIQFLTPGRSHFSPYSQSVHECVCVCARVLLCWSGMHAFLSTLFFSILEDKAARLHGITWGYTVPPWELCCRHSSQLSGSSQDGLHRHCSVYY